MRFSVNIYLVALVTSACVAKNSGPLRGSTVDISASRSIERTEYDIVANGVWFTWFTYMQDSNAQPFGSLQVTDITNGVKHVSAPIANATGPGDGALDVQGGRYFQVLSSRYVGAEGPRLVSFFYKAASPDKKIPFKICAIPWDRQQHYDGIIRITFSPELNKVVLQTEYFYQNGTFFYLVDPDTCEIELTPFKRNQFQSRVCTAVGREAWCVGFSPRKVNKLRAVDLWTGTNHSYILPSAGLPGDSDKNLLRWNPDLKAFFYGSNTLQPRSSRLWRFDLPTGDQPFSATELHSNSAMVFWDFDVNLRNNALLFESDGYITAFDPETGNSTYVAEYASDCPTFYGHCERSGTAYDEFYSFPRS